MATMVKLSRQVTAIVEEVYSRQNDAEANRRQEFNAAVKIQSWYRALRARAYLNYLVECSKIIQKKFRGFQGRREFRVFLKTEVHVMKLNKYNSLATKIQKVWRGYYVRKYIFNYHSFKRYLGSLQLKNQAIRESLAAYKEQQQQEKIQEKIEMHNEAKWAWLRKHHYLVSTVAVPGIYHSRFLPYPTGIEFDLRVTKPMEHPKNVDTKPKFNPTGSRYDLPPPRTPPLPPLQKKPQGPFREPEEVRQQRYKAYKPSLRVETSYFSLEEAREAMKRKEWIERINDTSFQPFTHRQRSYEPLHHTSTKYGHLPYGTAYFREEVPEKFVSSLNMKTVVPPIPLFDKLNDTFSQGEV